MLPRILQLNALLQERIGEFLTEHFETVPGTLVTVTRVATDPDLLHAKAFCSIFPETRRGSTLTALRKQESELRRALGRELTLHRIPRVHFAIDEVEAHAQTIEHLLDELPERNT